VTYHYLVAEVFRVVPATKLSYSDFFAMSKRQQADHIWQHLFVERTPISEACRGVLTTLQILGLDPNEKTLEPYRNWFAAQNPDTYIDQIMALSGVQSITMTNNVFDDNERNRWLADPSIGDDPRFKAVLRFDKLLRNWPEAVRCLQAWGYDVGEQLTDHCVDEARRFVGEWIARTRAIYCAVSLGPDFRYPAPEHDRVARMGQEVLERVVLPVCADVNIPMAMMIGSQLQVQPSLGDAGDMVGPADVFSVINLCVRFPGNRFLVTMLARENQHALCVAARKCGNLMPFGCWWFLNNPSLITEMTQMRTELLGLSYIPQHSDARILEQLIYKWEHSRRILGEVLTEKYLDLAQTGLDITREQIQRDVRLLLQDNFATFLAG